MSDRPAPQPGERLAKVIARAGICSRRDAEAWITAGRISVNGSPVKTPAFNVIEADTIAVDGKPIARKLATQLWLYHKPAGLMVTEKDPEGRPTVFEALSRLGLPRLLTVGRLDYNTEGLILLTNDGGLKRTLELPSTAWVRRYRVRAFGSVTQEKLDTLKNGITVEGIEYGPIEATLDSVTGSNVWVTVGLREGKNREVRNVFGALGLEVNRLIRISYGPFQLGDLPIGNVEKVKTRILKDQLGKKLAEAAGADFETPEPDDAGQPRRRAPEKPESLAPERDRFGGLRKRPERRKDDRTEQAPRVVHFDDGRPSTTHTPRKPRDKEGDRPERGARPERGGDFKKRFDDGPRKPREGDGKPFRKDGYKPRTDRDGASGGARPPRRDGPYKPREDGGKPFRAGPRPAGASADRPFRKGPRGDRPEGDANTGRPPRRDGGKPPFTKGPRREFDGERPPRRKDEDRPLARRTGPGKTDKTGERGSRADGGKPWDKGPRRTSDRSRAPSGPRGPRKDGGRPGGGRPPGGPRRPRSE